MHGDTHMTPPTRLAYAKHRSFEFSCSVSGRVMDTTRLQVGRVPRATALPSRFKRRASVTSSVLAPQKTRSSPVERSTQEQQQQQAEQPSTQWGWGPLNGLKLQWPASNAVDVQAQPQQVAAPQQPPTALDVQTFLGTCSDEELRTMRVLSHLCAQTYYMGQLTPSKLQRWHNMELVSTSLCCERLVFEVGPTDDEVAQDGDGMAGPSFDLAMQLYCGAPVSGDASSSNPSSDDISNGGSPCAASVTAGINNVVPFPGKAVSPASSTASSSDTFSSSGVRDSSSADSNAPSPAAAAAMVMSAATIFNMQRQHQQLQEAAAAARTDASSSAGDPQRQAGAAAGGADAHAAAVAVASSSKRGTWNPADLVAAKLSEAAAAAASAAATASAAASAAALQPLASAAGSLYAGSLSLVSSVTSSVASTGFSPLTGFSTPTDRVLREAIAGITSAEIASSHPNSQAVKAASTSSGSKCPSEWFVCDSDATNTRYFVIQGSDSFEHWKTNLMFEPVVFEGPEMGIKVHRGAYEAATALYERFLPLVQEAVHRDPTARVCFTGHSIGGAMAVLLMLMYVRRGVLRPQQVAPVYTFGSPGIFCDGALGSCSACITDPATGAAACSLGTSLLTQLGLADDAIRSIMMTRDIVPRAFSCDYTLVAELLRSWGPSWREHSCLAGGASGDGRRQLYVHIGRMHVLQPSAELPFITEPNSFLPLLPAKPELFALVDKPSLAHAMAVARTRATAVRNGTALGRPAVSRDEVLAAIMDCPHPLETLGEAGAYGTNGSISRYHNPDHYCMAIGKVLRDRRQEAAQQLGRAFAVPKRAARHRPFFPAVNNMDVSEGAPAAPVSSSSSSSSRGAGKA